MAVTSRAAALKVRLRQTSQLAWRVRGFLAKGPAYHATYGWWRLRRALARWTTAPRLNDRSLLAEFDLNRPELRAVRRAAREQGTSAALAGLDTYLQTRAAPRFFFVPEAAAAISALAAPAEKAATIDQANQVCQNRFSFRGAAPVVFEQGLDWTHRPGGSQEWTWDLNRHAYFETLGRAYQYTGDERYPAKCRALLLDWIAKNPAGVGQPNWSSVFEAAFRINAWVWAFHFFRSSVAFDAAARQACLAGLLAHGRYLAAHLELHSPNNHLLLEAKALALLGLAFPEFKRAARWRQRGLALVYREVRAQVCADGVHSERVSHYHRVISGELLELLVVLENNGHAVPADIRAAFGRLVEFELWLTKPDGRLPLLGDSALEDTHLRFSGARGGPAFLERADLKTAAHPLTEAELWLLGPERARRWAEAPAPAAAWPSRAFAEGGYYVLRAGRGAEAAYLVLDAGPFGDRRVPGHGHADALSLELHAHGHTWLVDPGVYSARAAPEWRNYFRGTPAHNTANVDGLDQSILLDTRRVFRPAQTTVHQWWSDDQLDFVDASHDGYQRLAEPVTHRRQVLFVKPDYWVVMDTFTGRGEHTCELCYHFGPGQPVRLKKLEGVAHIGEANGPGLLLAWLASGDVQAEVISGATQPIQGWVAFHSGEKQPAPVLCLRTRGAVPLHICTVLVPRATPETAPVKIAPLVVQVAPAANGLAPGRLTAVQIETGAYRDAVIVDRGTVPAQKVFDGETSLGHLIFRRRGLAQGDVVQAVTRTFERGSQA